MDFYNITFLVLSALTLLCAMMVVLSKSPIQSVLYLILTMVSLSGHYIILHAEFIATVNIIVYAGAIMVLFLFVLMLLNMNKDNEPNKSIPWKVIGGIVGSMTMATFAMLYQQKLTTTGFSGPEIPADFGYVKPLGNLLFNKYVLPFELASILFIAAMVGVIFLGSKEQKKTEVTE
jgi:NADH-quinone oxidoreductase subunit J